MKLSRGSKAWESYEQVAAYLLNSIAGELGLLRVEGKQKLLGERSGSVWEVDAKGVVVGGEGFVIVECRYTKSRQSQAKMAALAFQIIDTGAKGGIIVSPLVLQAGAKKVAEAENILSVQVDLNSTPVEFGMKFLNRLFVGASSHAVATSDAIGDVSRICESCGMRFLCVNNETCCVACAGQD